MRRVALLTAVLFLGQVGLCAHAGLGAAAEFGFRASMAASTCAQPEATTPSSQPTESPAQRCERHCAQVAQSVPAAAPLPQIAGLVELPLGRLSVARPAQAVSTPPAPERAPPRPPLRLLLSSLQV